MNEDKKDVFRSSIESQNLAHSGLSHKISAYITEILFKRVIGYSSIKLCSS